MRPNKLYMVIPCYNEEEVLPETARRLREKLTALMAAGTISHESRGAVCKRRQQGPHLGDHRPAAPGGPLFRGYASPGTGAIRMPCWPA